jgi:F-type H+-transporting ATPase subunit b
MTSNLIFLADFTVIRPDFGMVFWTLLIFSLFWFLMSRFAFKPIANALKEREDDIQSSLDQAKKAREEMQHLKAKNEELLALAQEERGKILQEAKMAKDTIIAEAKEKAREESHRIVVNAKQEIENMRMAAVIDLKNQVGSIAVDIAEKILQRELKEKNDQERYVKGLVDEMKIN